MAGNQLYANSQLMYYPTSELETLRMLGLIGEIRISDPQYNTGSWGKARYLEKLKEELGNDLYLQIGAEALDFDVELEYALYDYCIREGRYDLIKEYFNYNIKPNDKEIVIADLQAGEGEWLNTFKSFIPYIYNNNKGNIHIKTIANELEEERYNKIKANYKYLGSFEELQLPPDSISLLLFNPPYGESNGERNVRRYLRMTIERKYLINSGYIIMIINENDARDVADLFNRHFFLEMMYRTHKKEYDNFGQVVIIGRKRWHSLEDGNRYHAYDIEKGVQNYLYDLKNIEEFNLELYNRGKTIVLPDTNIKLAMENFEYVVNNKAVLSNKKSKLWRDIFDLTELKNMGTEKLILPKPPKQGEIANLLASGQINGTMQIEQDGEIYEHIVVGGVKTLEEQETLEKDGFTETKTLRYSKPYLNILIAEDGKYKIKELEVDMS